MRMPCSRPASREMPNVWAVVEDSHGAFEPNQILSMWTSQELAQAEMARLITTVTYGDGHWQRFEATHLSVECVVLNESHEESIVG